MATSWPTARKSPLMMPTRKSEPEYPLSAACAKIDVDGLLNDVPSPDVGWSAVGTFDLSKSLSATARDLFAVEKRKAWDKSVEARCDFSRKVRMSRRAGVWFCSIWQKSLFGRTLSEIKADDTMVSFFAENSAKIVAEILGCNLAAGGWAVCTTPKRRHKENNFATRICAQLATLLGIPFYEDAAMCRTRQRINAVFFPGNIPNEPNVILFDDFVTTGSTLRATADLLAKHNKNIFIFTGINNSF